MLVTVTPNAAMFEASVFEYRVKHCPFAQKVVVVCVKALKIVVRPVAPRKPHMPPSLSPLACKIAFLLVKLKYIWITKPRFIKRIGVSRSTSESFPT